MTDSKQIQDIPRPPLSILLADHYSEPPGYRIQRPNGLKDWFITFTESGQGRYLWEDKEYICNRGDIVVLPPGLPHDYGTASENTHWTHYWVHFIPQPAWLRWLLISENRLAPYICHVSDSVSETRIVGDFTHLLSYYRAAQVTATREQLEDVLLVGAQQYAKSISSGADERILTVTQYLYQHLNESIEVPMLAEMVAMSPSRLAHLFKEQMNDSIMQLLLKLRLRYAARLLRFTSLQIGKISLETGFESQFYFSRRFKAHFGIGPKEYRKHIAVP